MSLILDALRKLDREKSSRRNRTANIATEILRPDRYRPRRRTSLYFAAVSITIIVTAGITYALMMRFGFLSKSSPPASVTSPAASQLAALATPEPTLPVKPLPPASVTSPGPSRQVVPAPPESAIPVKPSPPAAVASPAASQQAVPALPESAIPVKPPPPASVASPGPSHQVVPAPPESAIPVKPSPPASVASPAASQQAVPALPESAIPVKPPPPASVASPGPSQQAAPAPLSHETVRNAQEQPSRVPPKIEPHAGSKSPATSAPSTPAPSLKISGIVWSEEPSERRAVINGTFTTEGSIIQGVKVVEINPKSVRFSHQGRSFEISVFE